MHSLLSVTLHVSEKVVYKINVYGLDKYIKLIYITWPLCRRAFHRI